ATANDVPLAADVGVAVVASAVMSQLQLRPNSLYVIARVLIAAFGVTDALTSDVPSHSNCRSVSTRYEPANPACVSPRRFELTVSSVGAGGGSGTNSGAGAPHVGQSSRIAAAGGRPPGTGLIGSTTSAYGIPAR